MTYYVIIMTVSCSAIIRVSFGTTILPVHDTTLGCRSFRIRASLGSVETGSIRASITDFTLSNARRFYTLTGGVVEHLIGQWINNFSDLLQNAKV